MDFSSVTVLCIGDIMLDRFLYGDMERISPEAPVPVLRLTHTREMLGGAGNVATNIASLGGRAVLIGLLGRDAAGDAVRGVISRLSGVASACIDTSSRPTICKTRFIASNQQVVRADEESRAPLTANEEAAMLAAAEPWIRQVGAVVLADYGKGLLTPSTISRIVGIARAANVPVFVDPKSRDFTIYQGATCITPNLKELIAAAGLAAVPDEAALVAAARSLLALSEADAILVTRSEKGMTLVERNEFHSVPARAREVYDVSGAGDTVIAAMALCYAAGRSLNQAMHVANAAASVVVSKLGTATATMAEVAHELDEQDYEEELALDDAQDPAHPVGLMPLSAALLRAMHWKARGLRVGFTNGCFDLLHPGHVALLAQARAACDRLVVGVNTDASVRRLKGPARPVNTLDSRAQVLAALRSVDAVVGFDDDTPLALIRALMPDVLVKGADYTIDRVVGADFVISIGGSVKLAELIPGQSTTKMIGRMAQTRAAVE